MDPRSFNPGTVVLGQPLDPTWMKASFTPFAKEALLGQDKLVRSSLTKTQVSLDTPDYFKIPHVQSAVKQERHPWEYITRKPRQIGEVPKGTATSADIPEYFANETLASTLRSGRMPPKHKAKAFAMGNMTVLALKEDLDHRERPPAAHAPIPARKPAPAEDFTKYLKAGFRDVAEASKKSHFEMSMSLPESTIKRVAVPSTARSSVRSALSSSHSRRSRLSESGSRITAASRPESMRSSRSQASLPLRARERRAGGLGRSNLSSSRSMRSLGGESQASRISGPARTITPHSGAKVFGRLDA